MIDLPEDDRAGIAIGEGERATGEEDQQSGGTPRPQAVPPCPIRMMCRAVGLGSCRKEPGCPSASFVTRLL